jgi:hypothetical protein
MDTHETDANHEDRRMADHHRPSLSTASRDWLTRTLDYFDEPGREQYVQTRQELRDALQQLDATKAMEEDQSDPTTPAS